MTTTTSAPNVATNNNNTSTKNDSGGASVAATINGMQATSAAVAAAAAVQQQQQQSAATARAMQSDEDFNIKFVNLVRIHKCLYDKKVPEYRNRDNQEKAWSLISQETRESVIHCKERWRNLRACLSRYIKQQSGADPQHKPYYLTEHMAFLLPFLKSTRNSLDSHGLAALFQLSQQHLPHPTIQVIAQPQLQFNDQQLEMKHSLSDNEDEDTLDAFDPAVTANLSMHQRAVNNGRTSAPLSDTASANTMQNFIPDVQLAELRTPEPTQEISYVVAQNVRRESRDFAHEPKRIKTECHGETATAGQQIQMYTGENSDMEFFRSILPDIAALTPQQKRKFKIGILELIDDVVERYPVERATTSGAAGGSGGSKQRRSSAREWRK